MGADMIGWAFNVVPHASIDFDRAADWSPDVYNSIVWDYSAYLNFSAKTDLLVEFG